MGDSATIEKVTDDNFALSISKGVVLVDFFADWCGPCRMLAPILEQIAVEMQGKAKVIKVDTEEAASTATTYRITSIPTLILFIDGKEVERVVGLRDAQALRTMLNNAIQK